MLKLYMLPCSNNIIISVVSLPNSCYSFLSNKKILEYGHLYFPGFLHFVGLGSSVNQDNDKITSYKRNNSTR